MDEDGVWQDGDEVGVPVVPEIWLVGPPPSDLSAVTFPVDHSVHLGFAGRIVDSDGNDITLTESGQVGEQALIFLTDGADQEYVAGLAQAGNSNQQTLTYIGIDLAGIPIPFVARGIRIVAVDLGGGSPGFDLGHVQASVQRECGLKACCPNPISGAVGIGADIELSWTPGASAEEHVVYFGSVASEVESGATSVLFPAQPRDVNSFTPPELQLGRTYYWRVDERSGADLVHRGDTWSFTVADQAVVDDFESYDLLSNYLYETWPVRGWAWTSIEQNAFHSCYQSMLFEYHYDDVYLAETVRTFDPPQDWRRTGAALLRLMVRGGAGNATDGHMYLTLSDGANEQFVLYDGDMTALARSDWFAWQVALDDFNDVDLTRVESITIGLRPRVPNPGKRSTGTLYIDDISLHPRQCLDEHRPAGDVTSDCVVDYRDLEQMSQSWLDDATRVRPVVSPGEPVLWYRFDGNAQDSAGSADGDVQGRPVYADGVFGRAIHFMSQGDVVVVPQAASVFAGIREAMTIAFWQYGDDSAHVNDTLCCSNYVYGQSNPAIAVHLGLWREPGQYRWDCGSPWSIENRVAGHHRRKSEWAGRWNHWAFTKDIRTGRMEVFLNGTLYDSRVGADSPIEGITSFEIGSGWYGRYDGLIDDFRIYDYALSTPEVAYLATNGTGRLEDPVPLDADLDASGAVNLPDFAILADEWLRDGLWP
jgi:hypothetical protein